MGPQRSLFRKAGPAAGDEGGRWVEKLFLGSGGAREAAALPPSPLAQTHRAYQVHPHGQTHEPQHAKAL